MSILRSTPRLLTIFRILGSLQAERNAFNGLNSKNNNSRFGDVERKAPSRRAEAEADSYAGFPALDFRNRPSTRVRKHAISGGNGCITLLEIYK